MTFDASTTNLTYSIPAPNSPEEAPVELTISFLSPITPTSTLRQSIPASYLSLHVNGGFDVDVYLDITGEWVSGNIENAISWEFEHGVSSVSNDDQALKTWKVKRAEEQVFVEVSDRAEWGTLHFSGPSDVQHESGPSSQLRERFARTGTLRNVVDESFRQIKDDWPVFAFSKSFILSKNSTAANSSSEDNVLFTIAHIQEPVAQFASARGLTFMRPLWASWFSTSQKLLSFHYNDFSQAAKLASNYSAQLASDALRSGSEDYKDIVALSARQVLGATSFSGTPENPILFLKEISSNGDFQTIDVIFPAFPFFLYTNPRWLAYLLEPLLEHQLSGLYPNAYSMHDLGTFPNATGYPDGKDEYMPVEECGDMLIMGLALINSLKYDTEPASLWSLDGDDDFDESTSNSFSLRVDSLGMDDSWGGPTEQKGEKQARKWVQKSYRLWKQWTGYLVREALIPKNQLSTDDFAGWLANQTNLAIKGIIGIRAMSEISETVGNKEDAAYYHNISDVYIKKWEEYGISRDGTHAKLAYTWYGSWTTLYNLFADALLCFHLPSKSASAPGSEKLQRPLLETQGKRTSRTAFVDEKIYKIQSDWYHNVRQKYGLPLDNRHLYSKTDWEFFTLAVTSRTVREEIMQSIALWVNQTTIGK